MEKYAINLSGILLAGGKSSRMGQDKAFMMYGEKFLFEYSLSVLKHFSLDIIVSSSNPFFNNPDFRRIEDEIPNLGPIGGILSCLKQIKNPLAIILPCDLPLINENIIELLIQNFFGYDISIALNHENRPEPLIGIYSSSIIPFLEKSIALKKYKIQELFSAVKTNFTSFPDLSSETFRNVNSPDDFPSLPGQNNIHG